MSSVASSHSQQESRRVHRKQTTSHHEAINSHLSIPSGGGDSKSSSLNNKSMSSSSSLSIPHYLQRMIDVQQMDIQSALDQMVTLCTLHPQRVYKTAYYRKQTKNHWARDDPAFAVLQIFFLLLSSIAYCIAFRNYATFGGILDFALRNIIVNWLGSGCIVASAGRALANAYLCTQNNTNNANSLHVKQRVEWLYAFDIHCNAFFPLFLILYGIQFFLLPLVLGESLFALILSNSLYALAFSWYFYITHLGYRGTFTAFLNI